MGNELQRIVDQFRQRDDLAVTQFRQFAACYGIGLARLVELNYVRLPPDLFAMSLSRRVIVNPPDAATYRILVYASHGILLDGCSIGFKISLIP
jgi:hypothetical protein